MIETLSIAELESVVRRLRYERRRERIARAAVARRQRQWATAAEAADRAGLPLNTLLSTAWPDCEVGDHCDGRVLDLPIAEQGKRVWAALRLVAARARVPWIAARGAEHDPRSQRRHLYLALHLPPAAIPDAIRVLERLTGAPAERVDLRGWSRQHCGQRYRGIVAASRCGAWMMQRQIAGWGGSADVLAFVAARSGADRAGGQHRLSDELNALAEMSASNVDRRVASSNQTEAGL